MRDEERYLHQQLEAAEAEEYYRREEEEMFREELDELRSYYKNPVSTMTPASAFDAGYCHAISKVLEMLENNIYLHDDGRLLKDRIEALQITHEEKQR